MVGAPVAWIGGAAIVAGGLIGGVAVAAYDHFFGPKAETTTTTAQAPDSDVQKKSFVEGRGDNHLKPNTDEMGIILLSKPIKTVR